ATTSTSQQGGAESGSGCSAGSTSAVRTFGNLVLIRAAAAVVSNASTERESAPRDRRSSATVSTASSGLISISQSTSRGSSLTISSRASRAKRRPSTAGSK